MTKPNTFENIDKWFWSKVDIKDDGECWIWKAKYKGCRYGHVKIRGRKFPAHRISYELHIGPITPGMYILHSCDNGFCVNPAHLRQGTQKDNMADMFERERSNHAKGDQVNTAKLTWDKVEEIRRRYIPRKVSTTKLGKEFGVSSTNISFIVRGKTWRDKNAIQITMS